MHRRCWRRKAWCQTLSVNHSSSGDGSEDQSPFKQELNAILYAAKGMTQAAKRGARGHVYLLTDCQAAILAVQTIDGHTACPCLVRDIRLLLQQASQAGIEHTWIWVPSHGKSPKWTPPPGHCADHLRALNAHADVAAANAWSRRLQGSLRQKWHELADAATQWEYQTIHVAAKAAERLHSHLMQQVT